MKIYKTNYILIGICFMLALACQQVSSPTNSSNQPDNTFITYGEKITPDASYKPELVKLHNVKAIPLDKPDTLEFNSSYTELEGLKLIKAGKPKVGFANSNSFESPITDSLIAYRKLALKPEKVIASNPDIVQLGSKVFMGYDNTSGLRVNYCHDIKEDKQGNLWGIAGSAGVFRFDGDHFYYIGQNQNLSPYSSRIDFDSKGNLWISTGPKLIQYDGKYFTEYPLDQKVRVSKNGARALIIDDNDLIWISTNIGLFRIDTEHKTKTLYKDPLGLYVSTGGAIFDSKQNLWIAGAEGITILNFEDKKRNTFDLIHYAKDHGLESSFFSKGEEIGLFCSRDGDLYTYGKHGITKIIQDDPTDYVNLKFMTIGMANGLKSHGGQHTLDVKSVAEDGNNNLYLTAKSGYLTELAFEGQQGKAKHYVTEESIKGNIKMHGDVSGNIWLSNERYALIKMVKNPFGILDFPEDLPGFHRMTSDKYGRVWGAIRNKGIYEYLAPKNEYESARLVDHSQSKGIRNIDVKSMTSDSNGNIWIGTQGSGVIKLSVSNDFPERNTYTIFNEDNGFYSSRIPSIFEGEDGSVWCSVVNYGGPGGMRRINNDHYLSIGAIDSINLSSIWAFAQSQNGKFWAMDTRLQKIINFTFQSDTSTIPYTHFGREHFITGYMYKTILMSEDNDIWLASRNSDGLNLITDLGENKGYRVKQFTTKEGLPSTDIHSVIESKTQNIWVNTSDGLAKISRTGARDKYLFDVSTYNEQDGFNPAEVKTITENHLFQSTDSLIWILGRDDKMYTFNPKTLDENTQSPSLAIDQLLLFNEEISWEREGSYILDNGVELKNYDFDSLSHWTYLPQNLSLRYDNNFVSFDFSGRTLTRPHLLEYSYVLKGFDNEWSKGSSNNTAVFGKLDPGYYTFLVKTRLGKGKWSDPVSYSFEVRSPWWRTWLAYVIYCLVILGSVFGFIRYRVERGVEKIRMLEQIRNKISADLHDDVGTILTGIAMQSEFLSLQKNGNMASEMTVLSSMSREAMEKMRDIVWAMDSTKDMIINLVDKMRYFAEGRLLNSNFQYTFNISDVPDTIFLHPEIKQNLYLVFKEAIVNILKHSNGNKVEISFKLVGKSIILSIYDNGSYVFKSNSEGSGLRNMSVRISSLNGTYSVERTNGYKLSIQVPLKYKPRTVL